MKNLGKNIRMLRHKNGWGQEDIALKLNISIPAFSKIETGITDINYLGLNNCSRLCYVGYIPYDLQ
jgi:transcriptional regulator with XRE-family HTH domain